MTTQPQLLTHFSQIVGEYDALICDIWGVLHDGSAAHEAACSALKLFRGSHGPVILLSNAPRPAADLEQHFRFVGVPLDCYDAIVTSGAATRDELARRSAVTGLALYHLGPERNLTVFEGLNVERGFIDFVRAPE